MSVSTLKGTESLAGLYRGRVENNVDPLKIGRVQVRVPMLHGLVANGGIPIKSLPWAMPSSQSAGYQYGSFVVPEVGEFVFVMFEDEDRAKPVYFGSSFGTNTTVSKDFGHKDYGDRWKAEKGKNEVPKRAQRAYPDLKMFYRSTKGSEYFWDVNKDTEKIRFWDRFKQKFEITTHKKEIVMKGVKAHVVMDKDGVYIREHEPEPDDPKNEQEEEFKVIDNGYQHNMTAKTIKITNIPGKILMEPDGTIQLNAAGGTVATLGADGTYTVTFKSMSETGQTVNIHGSTSVTVSSGNVVTISAPSIVLAGNVTIVEP